MRILPARLPWRLWLVQLGGNAVLLLLAYQWLSIPDEHNWQLAVSALLGVALALAFLWLHAAAFAYLNAPAGTTLPEGFWRAGRRLPRFLLWTLLALAAWWLFTALASRWTRGAALAALAGLGLALVLLVPLGAFLVAGPPGLPARYRQARYWLAASAITLVGLALPYWLVTWVPDVGGLGAQLASAVVRLGLAYAVVVAAWLALVDRAGSVAHVTLRRVGASDTVEG